MAQAAASEALAPRFHAVRAPCSGIASIIGVQNSASISRPSNGGAPPGWIPARRAGVSRQAEGQRQAAVLVTNAHPVTLAIKNEQSRLTDHFDAWYSTHAFHAPKKTPCSGRGSTPGSRSSRTAPCSSMTACPCSTPRTPSELRGCARCACRIPAGLARTPAAMSRSTGWPSSCNAGAPPPEPPDARDGDGGARGVRPQVCRQGPAAAAVRCALCVRAGADPRVDGPP